MSGKVINIHDAKIKTQAVEGASEVGIPPERAKAILENRGYSAEAHAGFNDALETVEYVVLLNDPSRR